jgi:putative FmdB family regulatory protein
MPLYEYRCLECRKRSSVFLSYQEYGRTAVTCPHCGSANLKRLISRVRVMRSEDSRLDSLADPDDWGDIDENDPRSVARAMRRMGDEMGEELPDEFDEVVDRLESGEDPQAIEKDIPDLAGGAGEVGDDGGDDFDF